jgi:hypothetical protein
MADMLDEIMRTIEVGKTYKAWSERVFGVWVNFTVTKVGTKLIHGEFCHGGTVWKARISPARFIYPLHEVK